MKRNHSDEDLATSVITDWERPNAGTWVLDSSHFSPDASRLARDAMEAGSVVGFERGLTRFGAPVKTIAMRFVNGHLYTSLRPLVGGGRDLPEPPVPVLKAMIRVLPMFRQRTRQAALAIDEGFAMQDHHRWETTLKPDLIAANKRFALVDTAALDDIALGDHIKALYAHIVESLALHMELHVSDLGPIGLLLFHGQDHGLGPKELMATLTGASPATTGPADALADLRKMVAEVSPTPSTVEAVRAISPEASAALDDWLAVFGDRLTTGYDVQAPTLRELENVVVASITRVDEDRSAGESIRVGKEAAARVLDQVPASERQRFTDLISDARALYGLRDENGPLTWQWPMGVMRRAVKEAQRRLVAAGSLPDPDGVFDLSAAEMAALLGGAAVPGLQEIQRRLTNRQAWTAMTPPAWLGPAPVDPPLDALTPPLRLLMEVIELVMRLIEVEPDAADAGEGDAGSTAASPGSVTSSVEGVGVGEQSYIGRACVVVDAEEGLARMEPGDVLIAPFTVPTYNAVLAIAGAVVVEFGGILCHAAVIAREFGIPGVVGAAGAMEIPNGAMVRVDPVAGSVTVLESVAGSAT